MASTTACPTAQRNRCELGQELNPAREGHTGTLEARHAKTVVRADTSQTRFEGNHNTQPRGKTGRACAVGPAPPRLYGAPARWVPNGPLCPLCVVHVGGAQAPGIRRL